MDYDIPHIGYDPPRTHHMKSGIVSGWDVIKDPRFCVTVVVNWTNPIGLKTEYMVHMVFFQDIPVSFLDDRRDRSWIRAWSAGVFASRRQGRNRSGGGSSWTQGLYEFMGRWEGFPGVSGQVKHSAGGILRGSPSNPVGSYPVEMWRASALLFCPLNSWRIRYILFSVGYPSHHEITWASWIKFPCSSDFQTNWSSNFQIKVAWIPPFAASQITL